MESIKRRLRYYKPCFDSGRAYAVKDNYFLIRPRISLRFVVGRYLSHVYSSFSLNLNVTR
ncbi:MAG: hypothetical protein RRE78_11045 [Acidianus sp.]|nr:hypothetical protein [Acidianus sp.]